MDRLGRISMLEAMLRDEPNDAFLNYALGLEYANELISIQKAEVQFNAALKADPNYFAAYYQLGKLFESIANKPAALSAYQKGLMICQQLKDHKASGEFNEAIFMLED